MTAHQPPKPPNGTAPPAAPRPPSAANAAAAGTAGKGLATGLAGWFGSLAARAAPVGEQLASAAKGLQAKAAGVKFPSMPVDVKVRLAAAVALRRRGYSVILPDDRQNSYKWPPLHTAGGLPAAHCRCGTRGGAGRVGAAAASGAAGGAVRRRGAGQRHRGVRHTAAPAEE